MRYIIAAVNPHTGETWYYQGIPEEGALSVWTIQLEGAMPFLQLTDALDTCVMHAKWQDLVFMHAAEIRIISHEFVV